MVTSTRVAKRQKTGDDGFIFMQQESHVTRSKAQADAQTDAQSDVSVDIETPLIDKQTKGPQKAFTESAGSNQKPREIGGPKGLEPTRYGDWEAKGRCYDF